jgi:hypothetical protein
MERDGGNCNLIRELVLGANFDPALSLITTCEKLEIGSVFDTESIFIISIQIKKL